jgi:hypothetical protein
MSTGENPVNWDRIADRLQQVMRTMLQEEGRYHDATFYADALRRTLGYVAAGEAGTSGRALPYERLQSNFGLITQAEADYLRDAHTIADRMGRERAEEQVKELRAELRRVYREAGKDLADMLRERCNERTVPSRYRRDGVAWAADMIDPSVPKDQYGRIVTPEAAGTGGAA